MGHDVNWIALLRPPAIVEIVERAAEASIEDGRRAESEGTIAAEAPAPSEECASLNHVSV